MDCAQVVLAFFDSFARPIFFHMKVTTEGGETICRSRKLYKTENNKLDDTGARVVDLELPGERVRESLKRAIKTLLLLHGVLPRLVVSTKSSIPVVRILCEHTP